jgi:hypothetical protein
MPETERMNAKARNLCLLLAVTCVVLLACACNGGSPTAPESSGSNLPAGEGALAFTDSGCACVNPPWQVITIFIDGKKAGTLPVFGKFSIDLPAGQHTWSDDDGDGPTTVTVQDRATIAINVFTNLGCNDGCACTDPTQPGCGMEKLGTAPQSRLHPWDSGPLRHQ